MLLFFFYLKKQTNEQTNKKNPWRILRLLKNKQNLTVEGDLGSPKPIELNRWKGIEASNLLEILVSHWKLVLSALSGIPHLIVKRFSRTDVV